MTPLPTRLDPVLALAIATALGLLIGLERGWHERTDPEGQRVAGVRSFTLIGLLGGVTGLLTAPGSLPVLPAVGLVAVAAALVGGQMARATCAHDLGVTSLLAGLLTFTLGAAAALGYATEAAMAAVAAALLLGYKSVLHRWVAAISADELHAGLKLVAISVIALPVLPDQGFGPWDALNPFRIWWMVVLIAGISFCGYAAMKIAGTERGALLTGLFAGLASSTALTLHFARLARRSDRAGRSALAGGVLLACGTMFPRMIAVSAIVYAPLAGALLVPMLAMAGVAYTAAAGLWLVNRRHKAPAPAPLANPLALGEALGFGALLALVMLAAAGLKAVYGGQGLVALAAVSGVADVDAITLALAQMGREGGPVAWLGFAVVVAAAVNSLVKAALVLALGGRGMALPAGLPLVVAALVGLGVAWGVGLPQDLVPDWLMPDWAADIDDD
ncbi:uncharacterized membrane protein (DUF4010 family) [Rhodothalassium salexigens DSM 2132]|uniref:Uncharacterized membrane protein (DUF4010 family) n=1 Tax=Rhodothalassium salexigens DSM 2132 TaxID=1188247 RepID=A0A4R2PGV8_RHOSA|nr:DUF4010 domain-containing protein [Rhodothalassium salexigens]MBB4211601.1 uncharacterized membrane protein (DUF4010 family) [Rhodothalassium salexigens DSM 2132]MBK1639552.1 hypothetical protein [Rhodothalassium salexigens DSM 2132]TCP34467.1 uncharacterized membrane protein (DUF4010 family) [Rhodothalassium salexigens DSM 2132]